MATSTERSRTFRRRRRRGEFFLTIRLNKAEVLELVHRGYIEGPQTRAAIRDAAEAFVSDLLAAE